MNQPGAARTRCRSLARAAKTSALAGLLVVGTASILASPIEAATTVYRSVDAEGRVIYSDTPPAPGESAEAVEIGDPESFSTPETAPPAQDGESWDWDMTRQPGEESTPIAYTSAAIVSPANDEGVRDNEGNVTVVAAVEPGLRTGDSIELLLDGQVMASGAGNSITLAEVDRGTHTLAVRVVDESGAIQVESEPSTFHMIRYVPDLAPNRPKPSPAPKPKPRGN